ncbi:MAG TPA: HAD family phosphatase [Thermoanaerobaculia bacterium]|nr:HAD family phosphatase [Thermoanaerobaculia bacterium]
MLRAILFDFNGVLVDDEPLHLALFARVLGEEGLTLRQDEYFARYLGLDDRRCFAAAMEEAGRRIDQAQIMRLVARKASYYQERIRSDGFPFFGGALELVREASAAGLTLGVVSGALRGEVEGALRQAGIAHLFKTIVAAEDVVDGKPDPEGYRRALEELNGLPPLPPRLFHPHEVLAIEDSPWGIEAASGAGLITLAVAHSYPKAALGAAHLVVGDLATLELDALLESLADATRA